VVYYRPKEESLSPPFALRLLFLSFLCHSFRFFLISGPRNRQFFRVFLPFFSLRLDFVLHPFPGKPRHLGRLAKMLHVCKQPPFSLCQRHQFLFVLFFCAARRGGDLETSYRAGWWRVLFLVFFLFRQHFPSASSFFLSLWSTFCCVFVCPPPSRPCLMEIRRAERTPGRFCLEVCLAVFPSSGFAVLPAVACVRLTPTLPILVSGYHSPQAVSCHHGRRDLALGRLFLFFLCGWVLLRVFPLSFVTPNLLMGTQCPPPCFSEEFHVSDGIGFREVVSGLCDTRSFCPHLRFRSAPSSLPSS